MSSFRKQPKDILDYDVDMEEWFKDAPGDDIERVTYTVRSPTEAEPALEIGPNPHPPIELIGEEPKRFKVWVGGGTDMTDYVIEFLVETEASRYLECEMKIRVRDR